MHACSRPTHCTELVEISLGRLIIIYAHEHTRHGRSTRERKEESESISYLMQSFSHSILQRERQTSILFTLRVSRVCANTPVSISKLVNV